MKRPKANFELTPGVRVTVSRPTKGGSTSVDYEVTLDALRKWLEAELEESGSLGPSYPPQLGHARI